MIGWIMGILATIIILMIIIKLSTRRREEYDDGDIWGRAEDMDRGACKKLKKLFGC